MVGRQTIIYVTQVANARRRLRQRLQFAKPLFLGEINLERLRMDTKQALAHVLHNRVAPSYLETR